MYLSYGIEIVYVSAAVWCMSCTLGMYVCSVCMYVCMYVIDACMYVCRYVAALTHRGLHVYVHLQAVVSSTNMCHSSLLHVHMFRHVFILF